MNAAPFKIKSEKNKRIVFVNTYEPVVPLYRDTFSKFRKKGYSVEALVSSCQYRNIEYTDKNQVDYRFLWTPKMLRGNRRICALLYYITALFALLSIQKERSKLVFLSQPPMFYILGSWIARLKGIPYYLHVMDFYPPLLYSPSNKIRVFRYLLDNFSSNALKKSEKVIVLGRCMRKVIVDKGVKEERISIVENWPEDVVSEFTGDADKVKEKYGLSGKIIVLYAGNMGNFHNFETILKVAKRLEYIDNLIFVFVGRGVKRKEILKSVNNGSKNILLLDHQPVESFCDLLAMGDIHFVSLLKRYNGLMVPSKFYNILAIGRPVVYEGSESSEVARVILEEECGDVILEGDVGSFECKLVDYLSSPEMISIKGKRAKDASIHRFNGARLSRRYVSEILEDV